MSADLTQTTPPVTPDARVDATRARGVGLALRLLDHSGLALAAAFLVSAAVGLLLIAASGADPVQASKIFVDSTVGTVGGIVDTLVYMTPRLFVALGAIVALRSGLFNLGGEGQLQMGAVGAVLGGYYAARVLPDALALPAALIGAAVLGALWAGLAAVLKIWRGAGEMITTLLLNFIATYLVLFLVQGPMRAEGSTFNQSERILAAAELPRIAGTRLHLGVVLALLVAALVAVLLTRTRLGLELRSVGLNPLASRFQGLSLSRLTVVAMAVSGAIAGLAGANEVLGVQFRLIQGFSPGYGFEGLAIAFLAQLRPVRAVGISLAFGAIYSAATQLQQDLGVSASLAYVVEGLPIVLMAAAGGVQLLRNRRREG